MFNGELTPAQKTAANKLCARKQMLLAWPQGSGKTVMAIAAAEKLMELKYITNVLVVAPTSIAWQWKDRIQEFTDHDDVRLVEAKSKLRRSYGTDQAIYTIVPYSVFRKDFKEIQKAAFGLMVADEAQEFSSFRSKTYKVIRKFKKRYRWALSGTAISNKLEELYAILQWIDPDLLPAWPTFEKMHVVRNPHTQQIIKYKNIETLHEYLRNTRVDRRTLAELSGSLPELISHKIYVEKDNEVKDSEHKLRDILGRDSGNFHQSIRMAHIDAELSTAFHTAKQSLLSETKLKKAQALIETILNESDENRIVVFCHYKAPIYKLYEQLDCAGLFTGDNKSDAKQAAIKLFRDGHTRVLICSDAGKAGLDLPFANYAIHLDVPHSFSVMDQRSKRIQRQSSMFQTVVVIYLLVKDSIEEFYYQVTTTKGKLATAVQEGGADTIVMRPTSLKDYLENVRGKD